MEGSNGAKHNYVMVLSYILHCLGFKKRSVKLIVACLDHAGKSSIINCLKLSHWKKKDIVPTVGLSVEHFEKDNVQICMFDLSGQGKYRKMWGLFFEKAQGIIFVVDVSDKKRICTSIDELHLLLDHRDLKGLPLLVFANKIDKEDSISLSELSNLLQIGSTRQWHIGKSRIIIMHHSTKIIQSNFDFH